MLIPLQNDVPNQNIKIELGGLFLELRLRYNERDSSFFLTILDADGQVLQGSLQCVLNANLLRYTSEVTGKLGFVNSENDNEPSLTNMNISTFLIYVPAT